MEHTRKMVLVPQESVNKLKVHEDTPNTLTSVQTPGDPTSRLDNELAKILNSNKNDLDKWNEYRELLGRFLYFNGDIDRKTPKFLSSEISEDTWEPPYSVENVLKGVPRIYQQKARSLIDHIMTADINKRFKWDKQGCVTLDNVKIPNSNIVDLVNAALRHRKVLKAVGEKEFATYLRGINAPRNYVGNASFWEVDKSETLGPSTPLSSRSKGQTYKKRLDFSPLSDASPSKTHKPSVTWQRLN